MTTCTPYKPDEAVGHSDEFEDAIAALFAAANWHVALNITHREGTEEFLEADLLVTRWSPGGGRRRLLVEAKGGGWRNQDVFALDGKRNFLGAEKALLLTRTSPEKVATWPDAGHHSIPTRPLHLGLTQAEIQTSFASHGLGTVSAPDLTFWRTVFRMRRRLLEGLRRKGEPEPLQQEIEAMKAQRRLIDDGIFEYPTPFERLRALTESYRTHAKLAIRVAHALDQAHPINGSHMDQALRGNGHLLVYTAMFLDTRARLATLTAVINYLLGDDSPQQAKDVLELLGLPSSTFKTVRVLRQQADLHLYPLIWQRFVYELGGLLLRAEHRTREIAYLATACRTTPEVVDNALSVWDFLYPVSRGSWIANTGGRRPTVLKLVPAPLQGLGAMRRQRLLEAPRRADMVYFAATLPDDAATFLKRVNNIAYYRLQGRDCPSEQLGPASAASFN